MKNNSTLLLVLAFLGIAFTSTAQNLPSYVPTTGLIGWWGLNGNASDSSGNANNGTVNGATLSTDRNGNANSAYNFNGTSDYIALPTGLASGLTTGQVTVAGWMYITTNSTWSSLLKNWGSLTTGGFHLGLADLTQKLNVQITQANGTTVSSTAPNIMSANAWHHVAFTADGSFIHLYQDAVEITTPISYNGTLKTSFLYTNIGAKPSTSNTPASFPGYLNGKADDIGLWSVALTQQQITGLFTAQPTGIESHKNENAISLFPNPTASFIRVQTKNTLNNAQVKVIDGLGNVVKSELVSGSVFELSLLDLPQGIYFIEIGEKSQLIRSKFCKQ